MMMRCVIWSVFAIGVLVNGAPPFIEPCKLSDSACVLASTQKAIPDFVAGIPELGIEVLDIMELEPLAYELAGLKFSLADGKIKGWKNAVVDRMKVDIDNKVIELDFHSDYTLRGHYKAGGQLLILPISGDGDMKLKIKDLRAKMQLPYEIVKGEDGKDRIKLKEYKYTFEIIGNAHYTLTNLFNGSKDLSDAMHNFLNENWSVISHDFGGPVLEAAVKKMFENVKKFFLTVPLDELSVQE